MTVLFKWCKLFSKVYAWCPFTHKEAETVCTTIFLPTITYPFSTTTLSATVLEKAQSMATPMIISQMGYNQNMPKAVIYTPSTHGGLGLKHLHTKQGLQKVLQVIKHLWTCTTLGGLLQVTIKTYQLQAGIPAPILEDKTQLPWLPHWWITNMCKFLHSIKGSIFLKSPWMIPTLYQHDHHLIQDFRQANLSTKDLQTLYLQVTTWAELTDHNGTCILKVALQCRKNTPSLEMISKSLIKWPTKPNPSDEILIKTTIQTTSLHWRDDQK